MVSGAAARAAVTPATFVSVTRSPIPRAARRIRFAPNVFVSTSLAPARTNARWISSTRAGSSRFHASTHPARGRSWASNAVPGAAVGEQWALEQDVEERGAVHRSMVPDGPRTTPCRVARSRYHPRMLIRRITFASAAVLLAACTSAPAEGGTGPSPSSSSGATLVESAAIERLEISEPEWRPDGGNWGLALTWTAPAVTVDHYVVRRNGITIDDDVDGTRFLDEAAEPGARYRYEVRGVDAAGASTPTTAGRIETAAPARTRARLDGRFLVRMVVGRSTGTRNPVRGGAILYTFAPVCRSGPCSVGWRSAVRRPTAP